MRKAERALDQILAEIQVGVWRPPSMSAGGEDPTFHEFASRWWFARKSELRPTTQADYEWRLRKHLLPFFADLQGLGDHDRTRRRVPQREVD
jgi:Phage integrase, N-terminal SAM-like domain